MIYLDACIVIYWVEEKPNQLEPLRRAFAALGKEGIAYSPLVQLECLVYPYRTDDEALLTRYQQFFSCATCLPLLDSVFDKAAQLRAHYPTLKTPDAIHLACVEYHNCSALWTNDGRLTNISHDSAINIVNEYS